MSVDYKSHELHLYSNDNKNVFTIKDTYQQEPGNEINTVNRFVRMELKGLDGTTNSRMVVIPQLAVYNKTNQFVLPVGWTIGELQEAVVRIDGELVLKGQQLAGLEADYTDLIEQETASRTQADGVHTQAIAEEVNAREQADTLLGLRITQEVSDRKAAISSLNVSVATNQVAVEDEKLRAEAVEGELKTSVTNEAKLRSDADLALGVRIDTEITDRAYAITLVSNQLGSEAKNRMDAVSELNGRIDFITHNTAPEALDSLSEIVAKFNADGATYASRLSAIEATLALLLNQ